MLEEWGELDHVFAIASVTKLLSAYAALVALEEASIRLDEPCGPPGSTVAHVLAHASGLSFDDASRAVSPPGTRRIYSNAGYELLAARVGEATRIPFDRYVHEAIAEPLGMANTRLVSGPAAGAVASARDLAGFAGEVLAPRLVDAATLARAERPWFPGLSGVLPGYGYQANCDWGLGFEVRDGKAPHWTGATNSPATVGHFGQGGSFIWVEPRLGLSLVCCSDLGFGDAARERWPGVSDAVLARYRRAPSPR